jgi:geranylgeranyl diphosphate synthase, type II
LTIAIKQPTAGAEEKLVGSVMRQYGALTRLALEQYLPEREPRRFFYDLMADYPRRGGKMMRPSLCIAVARMFGAPLEEALPTAVALELFHNALLIHDDIEDGSQKRRGMATLHVLHGLPLALNAGDGLALTMLRPLLENRKTLGERLALRIIEETERTARECAEGQALELGWRQLNAAALNDVDYLEMVLKKTCWLATIFPLRAGALIGTRDGIDLDLFVPFGFFLGAAFQIQDDLLNLVADERYGKERDGDLWEGKRTLMLIHVLREASRGEHERLTGILSGARADRTADDVQWIRDLMIKYGSVDHARRIANELSGAALHEFGIISASFPESRERSFLEQMATWVIERS